MKKRITVVLVVVLFGIWMMPACKKEEPGPNPYDDVDYSDSTDQEIDYDSEFADLHNTLLSKSCAQPGCHDGSFEPDFRTVWSSYATLVYHPIVKNNTAGDFRYRVVPFDTAASVLHERITNCCFVNPDDRMPQDNIGVPLPPNQIKKVEEWILNGAPDMFGQIPTFPNTKPNIIGYVAVSTDFSTIYSLDRVDSIFYNPFIVPHGNQMIIGVEVVDDSTAVPDLLVNRLKFSYDPDDFSSATSLNATYFSLGGDDGWIATVNTGDFPADTVVYMRYYVNDGDNASNSEFPTDNELNPYKTYWSFYTKP